MKLGVFTLLHARPWLVDMIVQQAVAIDPEAQVDFTMDRATARVFRRVYDARKMYPLHVRILRAPFPAVSDREHFMELRAWQLDQLRPLAPEYCAIWDDDHLLEDPGEAARLMDEGWDVIYADKAYLWDRTDQANVALPLHRSPFIFRLRPGDAYPLDGRMISAPAGVHDDPAARRIVMQSKLLDVGYLHPFERARVWAAYKKAGKIDQLTMRLVPGAPTELVPVRPSPVLTALKKRLMK